MSDTTKLVSQSRTEFGKGAARRIRRAHQIPAVLYGHGTAPLHLALPGHDTMLAMKTANAVVEIVLDGNTHLALVKDVQRNPIKPIIEHVDLVVIRRGEKVTVDVAVRIVGEAAPDTVVGLENQSLSVVADATHIPEVFEVSVEGLTAGTQIHASHVELPRGVELDVDPELLVVNISQAQSQEALEAELADAEAEAGIEHEMSEPEAAAEEGTDSDGGEKASDNEG